MSQNELRGWALVCLGWALPRFEAPATLNDTWTGYIGEDGDGKPNAKETDKNRICIERAWLSGEAGTYAELAVFGPFPESLGDEERADFAAVLAKVIGDEGLTVVSHYAALTAVVLTIKVSDGVPLTEPLD